MDYYVHKLGFSKGDWGAPPSWAVREMKVQDTDGHRLRMGSGHQGTIDEDGWKRFGEIQQLGQ